MERFLGKNLLFLRKLRNLQQAEMLAAVNIKPTTWSMYEADKSQPNLDVLIRISKYFEVTESDLLHVDLEHNAHLIGKKESGKKHQNAHVISHPIAHVNAQNKQITLSRPEEGTAFNKSLNEDQTPYKLLSQQLQELSSKVASIEANMSKKVTQMEDKIKSLSKNRSKM